MVERFISWHSLCVITNHILCQSSIKCWPTPSNKSDNPIHSRSSIHHNTVYSLWPSMKSVGVKSRLSIPTAIFTSARQIQIQQMRFRTSFHQNGERQLQRTLPTRISSLLWNKESTSLPIHHLFTHWTRNTKNSSKKRNDKQKQDLQRGSPTQRRNLNPSLSPMTILHPLPHHLPKKPVSLQKWCPISKTSTRTSSIGFTPSNPSTPAILFFPKWPPKQNVKIQ